MRYPVSIWWQGKEQAPCLGFFHCLLFPSCWEMLASSRYTLLSFLPLWVAIPTTGLQVHRLSSLDSNWDVPFQTKIFSYLPDPFGGHEGSQTQNAQNYSPVFLDFVSLLRGSQLLRTEASFLTPWFDHQASFVLLQSSLPVGEFPLHIQTGISHSHLCYSIFPYRSGPLQKVGLMCHCQLCPQVAWGWGCLLWANYYWAISIDWSLKDCVTSKDSHKLPQTDDLSTKEMYSLTFWRPQSPKLRCWRTVLPLVSLGEKPSLPLPASGGCQHFFGASTQMMTSLKSSTFSQFLPTYLSMLKILLT